MKFYSSDRLIQSLSFISEGGGLEGERGGLINFPLKRGRGYSRVGGLIEDLRY